jgi:hypothetical protein
MRTFWSHVPVFVCLFSSPICVDDPSDFHVTCMCIYIYTYWYTPLYICIYIIIYIYTLFYLQSDIYSKCTFTSTYILQGRWNHQTNKPNVLSHPVNAFLSMKLRFSATKAYENHAIVKFLESIGARLGNWWVGEEWGNQGLPTMCYLQIMYVHQNISKWDIATMNRAFLSHGQCNCESCCTCWGHDLQRTRDWL